MSVYDWLIAIVPVIFVLGVAVYTRKYIHGVADFLAAGRVCGRYVISVGDVANALSIIGLVAYVEVHYKTGFGLAFWEMLISPVGIILGLFGFCTYRFRETRAMSLGQFLEMRYNRAFRIFAATLRSISEMLANMILPAVAARFFIYFLDLPQYISIFGVRISTFMLLLVICLSLAISIICLGGTLALVITDAFQGMMFFPLIAIFVIFILCKFSWSEEIIPVMMDRVAGESFLNPYDLDNLRDFNLFFVVFMIFSAILHRASWIGAGTSCSARNPQEQKMGSLLGTWRNSVTMIFYVLVAISVITLMNHRSWAGDAKSVRDSISSQIARELIGNEEQRREFNDRIGALPAQIQQIGIDPPLSQARNLDTPMLDTAHSAFREFEGEAIGNDKFQQYRTLFHQMLLGRSMRELLPPGLVGLFCLMMILAMVSTDDTRIYSATITLTQDVIIPLRKKSFTPKQHIWALRLVAIGIGVFFLLGSCFMAQLDYINLFVTLMTTMWMGGCGPVMIFGLYSRFGTTAGAFTSVITGMLLSVGGIVVQRNWANFFYPWLLEADWVEPLDGFLTAFSSPLAPYVVWEMNPVKFPVNSYEFAFITMLFTLFLYCAVSFLTLKKPFNLDRMLHRGIYDLAGEKHQNTSGAPRTWLGKLLGITSEYTFHDKFIAVAIFGYSIIYNFIIVFVLVLIWNAITPWPLEWWSIYSFIVYLLVPGLMALITAVWFSIGGVIDLRRLFRDLAARRDNPLDNGEVEGHVSLVDREELEKLDHQ